ncbi:reverse transcriptase family protein [Pseudomonas sp. DWP3-1-2]|uniref:reverse transcriptase family protein n=1 Tax=Pseudomonas sp. DWP3-1-2 TaxID=2804645 RepID=UPI003CEF0138
MAGIAGSTNYKVTLKSISTVENLAVALSVKPALLSEALSLPDDRRYTKSEIPKSDGGVRRIYNPDYLIRLVQRRINSRIFSDPNIISWPDFLYGSIPNHRNSSGQEVSKDHIACAAVHCGAKSLLKLDVQNFFDNIHSSIIFNIFNKLLKLPEPVSSALTNICTYEFHLVQGALTSSYLASLCLYDLEAHVVDRLSRKGIKYTRFVDDITLSTKISNFDFTYARSVVEQMLTAKDLPLNSNKCKAYYSSSEPLMVHGLRICFKEPRLPSDEVRRIRASVKNIEIIAAERAYRLTHAYRHDFNRCMGKVNKLARLGHIQHTKLVARLVAVYPLPSKRDISRALQIVMRLERDVSNKRDTYWYAKRFYMAHERLNILTRCYPRITSILRTRLRKLRPAYE